MAESVFAELVRRAGREAEFVIDSAATSTEEIGNPPHHGTVGKITRLLDWTDRPGDVADPWYTGNFDATYRDVLAGCTAMLEQL